MSKHNNGNINNNREETYPLTKEKKKKKVSLMALAPLLMKFCNTGTGSFVQTFKKLAVRPTNITFSLQSSNKTQKMKFTLVLLAVACVFVSGISAAPYG